MNHVAGRKFYQKGLKLGKAKQKFWKLQKLEKAATKLARTGEQVNSNFRLSRKKEAAAAAAAAAVAG